MNKIPTAEEYIRKNITDFWEGGKAQYREEDVSKAMIEFAKLHVEAQEKAILKNVKTKQKKNINQVSSGSEYHYSTIIDKKSIINAYSLENIK